MKTTLAKQDEKKNWYVIDADGMTLGRLAAQIANILRGRNKVTWTPHIDCGDYVIVINAEKVRVTGKKEQQKEYMIYTGYRGNEHYLKFSDMRENQPDNIIKWAVWGMLPRNRLTNAVYEKLKVFKGPNHNHEAQCPVAITVK